MIFFWTIALAMTAIALLFILQPVIRAHAFVGHRLILTVGAMLPLAAIALYSSIGTPGAMLNVLDRPAHPQFPAAQTPAGSLQEMTRRLESRLRSDPADPDGWILLARSYQHLERHTEADEAYGRAIEMGATDVQLQSGWSNTPAAPGPDQESTTPGLSSDPGGASKQLSRKPERDFTEAVEWATLGRTSQTAGLHKEAVAAFERALAVRTEDSQLWADYADALAMTNGGRLSGAPREAAEHALRLDANNRKALWLMGTAAFQEHDYSAAVVHWQRLQRVTPADSADTSVIAANVAEAGERLDAELIASPSLAQPAQPAQPAPAAVRGDAVRGVVTLDPSLAGSVADTDTVFIFARAAAGPPMPLAVLRKRVQDLPISFELDDSMAMLPSLTLSQFPEIVVGARISRTGSATPQAGDLAADAAPAQMGSADPLQLVINSVVEP